MTPPSVRPSSVGIIITNFAVDSEFMSRRPVSLAPIMYKTLRPNSFPLTTADCPRTSRRPARIDPGVDSVSVLGSFPSPPLSLCDLRRRSHARRSFCDRDRSELARGNGRGRARRLISSVRCLLGGSCIDSSFSGASRLQEAAGAVVKLTEIRVI